MSRNWHARFAPVLLNRLSFCMTPANIEFGSPGALAPV